MDFLTQLGIIEDYIKFARGALKDEREGNLKYYVDRIDALSSELNQAVKNL